MHLNVKSSSLLALEVREEIQEELRKLHNEDCK